MSDSETQYCHIFGSGYFAVEGISPIVVAECIGLQEASETDCTTAFDFVFEIYILIEGDFWIDALLFEGIFHQGVVVRGED